MAQNPLLGSRISLISKKNIRYEGTLYSINESDATVVLQNVKSYGTEGREKADPENSTHVPPQDAVHPYLLFRGCDIKDLHVHENVTPPPPPPKQEPVTTKESVPVTRTATATTKPKSPTTNATTIPASTTATTMTTTTEPKADEEDEPSEEEKPNKGAAPKSSIARRPKKTNTNPNHQVGTGASLLNRKPRGTVEGGLMTTPSADFDFQSNLENFQKGDEVDEEEDEEPAAVISPTATSAYAKDDFFDSISCDALDKQNGVDNRLRGAAERNLNTETFGAVALNGSRRGRRYRGGGGGGRGRGRGRGNGAGTRGGPPRPRENNRWKQEGGQFSKPGVSS